MAALTAFSSLASRPTAIARAPASACRARAPARCLVVRAAAARAPAPPPSRRGLLSAGLLAAATVALPTPALAGTSLAKKITKQTDAITGWVEAEQENNPSVYVAMTLELEQVRRGAGDSESVENLYQDMRRIIQAASRYNRSLDKEQGEQVLASIKEIRSAL